MKTTCLDFCTTKTLKKNAQSHFSKKPLTLFLALATAITTGSSIVAQAAPLIKNVTVNGAQVNAGQGMGMSRSGRYILTAQSQKMSLFDIKTQTAVALQNAAFSSSAYAISPNGRYVAYTSNGTPDANNNTFGNVFDQVTQKNTSIFNTDEHKALSNNGFAAFREKQSAGFGSGKLVLLNTNDLTKKIIPDFSGSNSSMDRHDWLSADGKVILYEAFDATNSTHLYKIYNADTQQTTAFTPLRDDGITPITMSTSANNPGTTSKIALSSNGKFITFTAFSGPAEQNIWRATLNENGHTLERFNLINSFVTVEDGMSISSNGRFVSFRGKLQPNHPEFAAAQTINSLYRIFRYDLQLNKLITVSVSVNGSPLKSGNDAADVYSSTIISDDGSIVEFSTNADNMVSPSLSDSLLKKYYAILDNELARNYQFVDMPNSDTNFKPFAPMTLVGNNLWEGSISFDGVGTESFKFDVGGRIVNGAFEATPHWGINFGAGSTAGQAVSGGGNIPVTGGAGIYTITFNDKTLKYTITKQNPAANWKRTVVFIFGETQTGQDMFIRGGLDHNQAKINLGINCDLNNELCSMPIKHLNLLNPTTAPWKQGDTKLDWQISEAGQGANAQGSPLDWTTNLWPTSWGAKKTVAINGFGETPLNLWGHHYWMLDVEMDCSRTVNGWFELKSFISNGPGWESDITQPGAPWASNNHFAQCGKLNAFKRGQNNPVTIGTL